MQAPARDPRRLIARLAVAVMAADGRITPSELDALAQLNALGLGSLSLFIEDEIRIAATIPVDVEQACATLGPLNPSGAAVLVATLADIASADSEVTEAELAVLRKVARHLGLSGEDAAAVLNRALHLTSPGTYQRSTPVASDAADALTTTGPRAVAAAAPTRPAPAAAEREQLDRSYIAQVQRYDLGGIAMLGPEFVVLAIHKLARLTAAYEDALAQLEASN